MDGDVGVEVIDSERVAYVCSTCRAIGPSVLADDEAGDLNHSLPYPCVLINDHQFLAQTLFAIVSLWWLSIFEQSFAPAVVAHSAPLESLRRFAPKWHSKPSEKAKIDPRSYVQAEQRNPLDGFRNIMFHACTARLRAFERADAAMASGGSLA